ncbi:MAG: transposase [Solirubrobacterales bacterium]
MPSRNIVKHYRTQSSFHAYNQGINGASVFADDHDRRMFMAAFEARLADPGVEILAYCLMVNHYHLVVRQREDGAITRLVRGALSSYVRQHNGRHNRYGVLFRDCFKAARVDSVAHLRTVIGYTHLNPLEIRSMPAFETYEFSSHSLYSGDRSASWFDPAVANEIFGSRDGYLRYMQSAERRRKQLGRDVSAIWSPVP